MARDGLVSSFFFRENVEVERGAVGVVGQLFIIFVKKLMKKKINYLKI